MIPEAKQPAVTRALHATFSVDEYDDIRLMTGGLSSALAFKIVVKKIPYLLKILRTEIISDPRNEFACMQTAAEAGIAPRIWYANVEDRILITDFVEAKPFPDDLALLGEKRLRRALGMPIAGDEVDDVDEINETPRTGGGLNAPIDHGYGMGVPKPELSPARQARIDALKAERAARPFSGKRRGK